MELEPIGDTHGQASQYISEAASYTDAGVEAPPLDLTLNKMTATETSNAVETIDFLRETIDAGEHWYVALLRSMARWTAADETFDGRYYRYLIGGEAFDWLVLAERLIDELG